MTKKISNLLKIANTQKTFKIMKLVALFLTIGMSISYAGNSYSQITTLSLKLKNKTVREVFKEIEKNSEYIFLYNRETLDPERVVTISAEKETISDVLDRLFEGTDNTYKVSDRQVYISKAEKRQQTVIAETEQQQKKAIHGSIIDQNGEAIIGANVIEKGTTNGTVTDIDGNFSLQVEEGAVLQVSYIGYLTQEINSAGRTSFNITLAEDMHALDEVVIVAYGAVRKSDLTGSVASISADKIREMPAQSLDKALQGKVPGVQVKTNSASPGGSMNVVIRGGNSLMSGLEPLYVIDGFPVAQSYMNSFSSDDVESIEILKDASATALYGSRASNGVILITTKKGKIGVPSIEYSNYLNFQFVDNDLNLLNGEEFAMIYNEWLENQGLAPVYVGTNRYFPKPEDIGEGTNWFEQISRMGFTQNHQLTISGGKDNMSYMISANHHDNEGVILGGEFTRTAIRSNIDIQLFRWLKIFNNFSMGRTVRSGSGENTNLETTNGTIANMIKMSPALPVYDYEGNYTVNNFPGANSLENPVAIARELYNRNLSDYATENLGITFMPIKSISVTSRIGFNVRNNRTDNYIPTTTISGAIVDGRASISNGRLTSMINENIVTYDPDFNTDKHRLSIMLGHSIQKETNETNGMSATNFPTDYFLTNNIGAATEHNPSTSWKTQWQLASYLGRVNYALFDKYLFTITGRADGSSRFAQHQQWALFPSIAFAWKINEERFMDNVNALNNLKLRMSWGKTGNQNIGMYKSMMLMSISKYPFGATVQNAAISSVIADDNLKWETTSQYNIGLDVGIFRNRISATIEYYYKQTSDLLLNQQIPSTSGYSSILTNVGKLENQGLEMGLNTIPVSSSHWYVSLDAGLSFNRNKLLVVNTPTGELWMDNVFLKEGYQIGLFRGQAFDGIFKSQEEIDNYVHPITKQKIMPGAKPGDVRYLDVNNDGIISGEDWEILGNSNPDFIWNFGGDIRYQNFGLSFHVFGSQGNDIRNVSAGYYSQVSNMRSNLSRNVLDRWHEVKNPDGNFMRLAGTGTMPNIEDGSFIKLQNVRLSYNTKLKFSDSYQPELSLFVSAQNILTITKYSGFDPDINTMGNSNVNFGTDNTSFPNPKVISTGLSLKF